MSSYAQKLALGKTALSVVESRPNKKWPQMSRENRGTCRHIVLWLLSFLPMGPGVRSAPSSSQPKIAQADVESCLFLASWKLTSRVQWNDQPSDLSHHHERLILKSKSFLRQQMPPQAEGFKGLFQGISWNIELRFFFFQLTRHIDMHKLQQSGIFASPQLSLFLYAWSVRIGTQCRPCSHHFSSAALLFFFRVFTNFLTAGSVRKRLSILRLLQVDNNN